MKKSMFLAVGLFLATVGSAFAAQVNITNITGVWQDASPVSGISGEGTSSLRWGSGSQGQSGYDFDAAATPIVNASSPFYIGDFTHLNYPITGTTLSSVSLNVGITGDVDGVGFFISGLYDFAHNETPNSCAPLPVCSNDEVTYQGGSYFSDTIEFDGEEYAFGLTGFGALGSIFSTVEGQSNTASLYGEFTTTPIQVNQVPLPAGGLLILTALGGLGFMRRRKNAATA